MARTDQLEREAEQTRIGLSATLDHLRARLAPTSVQHAAIATIRGSASARFTSNLVEDAATNTVPLAILGGSLVWLFLREKGHARAAHSAASYAGLRHRVLDAFGAVRSLSRSARGAASATTSALQSNAIAAGETATAATKHIAETSAAVRHSARSAAVWIQEGAKGAMQRSREGVRALADEAVATSRRATTATSAGVGLARTDPVFIAGVGLAAAGIAAAVFAWSRQSPQGEPAGDLACAADSGQGALPVPLSSVSEDKARLLPDSRLTAEG